MKELSRAEVHQYISKNYSYTASVLEDFCTVFLHKKFNLESHDHMFYNQMINVIMLKRGQENKIEGWITNNLKKTLEAHKSWSTDFIYITDHTVQMKEL